jgi:DNA-binding NarL/FixJ family response regulator
MENELLSEVKRMSKLLALNLIKDTSWEEKLILLSKAGYTPKEMADIIGTTNHTISTELHKIKKKRSKK